MGAEPCTEYVVHMTRKCRRRCNTDARRTNLSLHCIRDES